LPSGSRIRKRFGVVYGHNEGQLLEEEIADANGATLKSVKYQYFDDSTVNGQAFSKLVGVAFVTDQLYSKQLPLISTETSQEGVTYRTEVVLCSTGVYCFDAFARPTKTRRSNTLGYARTDVTEYHDNLHLWVLGQQSRLINVDGGATIVAEKVYNPMALPEQVKAFGKIQRTLGYSADGTLTRVTDGRGYTTVLTNWKRGVPQGIRHPATPEAPSGATESYTVNESGWITSITDENGYVTGYGYDAMGRLASIVYPSGANESYHNTLQNFRALTENDWKPTGVAPGQWRLYKETGSHVTITYMDALWRPVLKHEYDANNVASTLRSEKISYDSSGRLRFQSYPSSSMIPGELGIRKSYDALNRVTRVEQDSEQGALTTSNEYLPGLRIRTTNPRGFKTETRYMAWDAPGYEHFILAQQPENKTIEVARHPQFGWPLQLKQREANGNLAQSQYYVYDAYGQLCKTVEPERGATVMDYDGAGNLSWSASGLTGPVAASRSDCGHALAGGSGRVIYRAYDGRDRLTNLAFPEGRGNQVRTYKPDGLLETVIAYNDGNGRAPVVTTYEYNRRRLLTAETLSQPSLYSRRVGYTYDAYANLRFQAYPTGLVLDYSPNPLGQATQVRDQLGNYYASGAQYYPNGALKQFTYGNGIVHTMIQNARQLPRRTTDSGNVVDYDYAYDRNGNVERIYDYVIGTPTLSHRWMAYDGLDRLTSSASAVFGGTDHTHRFTYDALDNLKSWKLGGVKDYAEYVYNSRHQLVNIRDSQGATIVGLDYDEQGNLQNKNGQVYDYDYGNRLRAAIGKELYRYDGHGRRVQVEEPAGNTTFFQYVSSGKIIYQESHRADGIASEHLYLDSNLVATRERPFANAPTTIKYQHTDALGSLVATSDTTGRVIERLNYDPYGAVVGSSMHSGIGYTGHVMDGGTGLTYMQQRYYDPAIGRFLSVDPVTVDSSTGANFNRYKYAGNNPYRFYDPDGRADKEVRERTASVLRRHRTPESQEQLIRSVGGDTEALKLAQQTHASFVSGVIGLATGGGIGGGGRGGVRQGPVIIGETMARVEAFAAKIPGAKILNDMPDFKAMGMNAEQATSAMMQYNRRWILEQIRSGRQIIDIGADAYRKAPSIFYQMEQNMLRNYQKLHAEFSGAVSP